MNFSSKLGLYDFLNLFIMGLLWVVCFCPSQWFFSEFSPVQRCCKCQTNEVIEAIMSIAFFSVCFVTGLVVHHLPQFLICRICKIFKHQPCTNVSTKLLRSLCRNDEKLIAIWKEENSAFKKIIRHSKECTMRQYYFAYYYLQSNGQLGNIPVLEAQEAFTKDLLILILGLWVSVIAGYKSLILHYSCNSPNFKCCIICGLPLLFILIFILHAIIQNKIYSLVWEGTHYLSRIEYSRTENTKMLNPCLCKDARNMSQAENQKNTQCCCENCLINSYQLGIDKNL